MTKVIRLGEIAEIGAGNSAPQNEQLFKGGTLPFVRTSDVGAIHIGGIESSRDLLTPEGARGLKLFPAGTILFPKSGASTFLNHRVILNCSAYVSSHLATIKANSEVALDRYIFYFLQTVDARDLCQDQAYPSLNRDQIAGIEVPLPSLKEQQKIVDKFDKGFNEIALTLSLLRKRLDTFSLLEEGIVDRRLSQNFESFTSKKLKDITSKIGSGATPRGGEESYKSEGISLIRSLNVYDDGFRDRKLAYIDDVQANALANVEVMIGDVLLNITGASIARTCVAPKEFLPARVNQHVSIIRPNPEVISSEYLHFVLRSKKMKNILLGVGNSGGSTRQALTKVDLENTIINFPPELENQKKVVDELVSFGELSQSFRSNLRKLESLYSELGNSLLISELSGSTT